MEQISDADKLKEVERELMQRHRTYRRLVSAGKMKQPVAARQIAIMTSIANDYRERIATPLFAHRAGDMPPLPAGSILKGD